jgi:hypothetical protein
MSKSAIKPNFGQGILFFQGFACKLNGFICTQESVPPHLLKAMWDKHYRYGPPGEECCICPYCRRHRIFQIKTTRPSLPKWMFDK